MCSFVYCMNGNERLICKWICTAVSYNKPNTERYRYCINKLGVFVYTSEWVRRVETECTRYSFISKLYILPYFLIATRVYAYTYPYIPRKRNIHAVFNFLCVMNSLHSIVAGAHPLHLEADIIYWYNPLNPSSYFSALTLCEKVESRAIMFLFDAVNGWATIRIRLAMIIGFICDWAMTMPILQMTKVCWPFSSHFYPYHWLIVSVTTANVNFDIFRSKGLCILTQKKFSQRKHACPQKSARQPSFYQPTRTHRHTNYFPVSELTWVTFQANEHEHTRKVFAHAIKFVRTLMWCSSGTIGR